MYFIKYLLVGVINTTIGFGLLFLLMFLGVNAYLANIAGYLIGVIVSFILNSKITFKAKGSIYKFFLSMFACWVVQFIILRLCLINGINEYISQIIAGGVYVISGFLLSKIIVFKV